MRVNEKIKIIDHIKYDDEGDMSDSIISKRFYKINNKRFEINRSGIFTDGDIDKYDYHLNDEEHNI